MHLPLTTPFFPDGRLNLRKLEQNVAHYSLTPAAGIVVLGTTGEPTLLSDEETRSTLKSAIGAASATKVMLSGTSRNSVRGTLDLLEYAAELNYDAALIHPPTLPGLSANEARLYLQTIADRSPLPLILTGNIPQTLIAELAFHPQILGFLHDFTRPDEIRLLLEQTAAVKRTVTVTQVFAAATRRMLATQTDENFVSATTLTGGTATAVVPAKLAIKTRTKVVGFQILVASAEHMLAGLTAGAVGAVPPFAASAPQGCYEVVAAWKDGDPALAEEKQLRLMQAAHSIERGLGAAGLKYGCDLNGYFGGFPRLPLLPLTGEQRTEIETLMQGLQS